MLEKCQKTHKNMLEKCQIMHKNALEKCNFFYYFEEILYLWSTILYGKY